MDRAAIVALLEEMRAAHARGDTEHIAEMSDVHGRWIQATPFVLNLDYPLTRNPKKLLKQLQPPSSVILYDWQRKKYVTLAFEEADIAALPDLVLRYLDATG